MPGIVYSIIIPAHGNPIPRGSTGESYLPYPATNLLFLGFFLAKPRPNRERLDERILKRKKFPGRVIKSLAIAFTVLLAGNCHCNQRGFRDYLSSVESEGRVGLKAARSSRVRVRSGIRGLGALKDGKVRVKNGVQSRCDNRRNFNNVFLLKKLRFPALNLRRVAFHYLFQAFLWEDLKPLAFPYAETVSAIARFSSSDSDSISILHPGERAWCRDC
ncbi:hypothetical protein SLEP1_g59841 [Rubroshorea leprosula]|uniref:Uncharacterized protein n=1 Tax=Rubroshorea leprosula TaxID=152421 RepID=A0AAV5MWG0_9ROSI|nr:hypothetical protein SLEP1_g59841 [Rubroshorea leprosula]